MKSYELQSCGKRLKEVFSRRPKPKGKELLLKTISCGVCHSDLHIQNGYFDLGNGDQIQAIHQLPHTMGHEIYGEVVAVGEQVSKRMIGKKRVVYPWIGCGNCSVCDSNEEQYCFLGKNIGISTPGGYAEYVIVPDTKYLFDSGKKTALMSGCFACSGLTSYVAIKKILFGKKSFKKTDTLVFVGLGGVGIMGLNIAIHLFKKIPIVIDIDSKKLEHAKEMGVELCYNPKDNPDFLLDLLEKTGGGASGAIDFVGSEQSFDIAFNSIKRGGTCVITGLFGGKLQVPLPLIALMSKKIIGSYVGNLAEMQELMAFVKKGLLPSIPIEVLEVKEVNKALKKLKSGKVLGRLILLHNSYKKDFKTIFSKQLKQKLKKKKIQKNNQS